MKLRENPNENEVSLGVTLRYRDTSLLLGFLGVKVSVTPTQKPLISLILLRFQRIIGFPGRVGVTSPHSLEWERMIPSTDPRGKWNLGVGIKRRWGWNRAVRNLRTRDARPKTGRDQPKSGKAQADPPAIPQPPVLTDIALEATGAAVGVAAGLDYFVEGAEHLPISMRPCRGHHQILSFSSQRQGRSERRWRMSQ